MSELGPKLRTERKRRGALLRDYARRLNTTSTTLGARERGHVPFRHDELPRIAEIYGVSRGQMMAWIWDEEDPISESAVSFQRIERAA